MFLTTSLLIFCTKMLLCLSLSMPSWVSLCDEGLLLTLCQSLYDKTMPGHVYLFSEELLEWEEARDMCSLLGGS